MIWWVNKRYYWILHFFNNQANFYLIDNEELKELDVFSIPMHDYINKTNILEIIHKRLLHFTDKYGLIYESTT